MNSEYAEYFFHQGTNFNSYKYMGCTLRKVNRKYVYCFRTWAPNAHSVELVCDFLGWDNPKPLTRVTDNGVWELEYKSENSLNGSAYKYKITSDSGVFLKGDPYARYSKGKDDGASVIFCESAHKWNDATWKKRRKRVISNVKGSFLSTPINIYEIHLGSFIRHEDNSYYSYRELAEVIIPYVKQMGYTHVELLPIAEYPFDASWGYQVCAFYAPTSRFGDPDDFKYFINELHINGIGIILDWVPAHFPKDEWGLYQYDGYPLYEYQGTDRMESRSWGTRFFDLGREEIQSFLISNALYFFREFHIDGLRVDAVASIIYLDYDREPGKWVPNSEGTNLNFEGIAFLQKLNKAVFAEFPDVLMIAEESGSFNGITKPVHNGGLGFNMKWNMGWANDFYSYLSLDPLFRKYKHKALNFPLMYAFKENYCLPISHDEVVHGKKSFIDKCFGSYEDKFRQARLGLMLMYSYPGKKLLFMGTEYGQFREWDFDSSLEWFMNDFPSHRALREYVAALNCFYLMRNELWELDFDEAGFKWILADEAEKNVVAYRRYNKKGESLIFVLSFSGAPQRVALNGLKGKKLKAVFATEGYPCELNEIEIVRNGNDGTAELQLPQFFGIAYKEDFGTITIKI